MKRWLILLGLMLAVPAAQAACEFKADTASQTFLIGPFLDQTDGTTAETGITVANTDIRISKSGGNIAAKNSGGGTHDENGWYQITLDATDTDTEGPLQIHTDDQVNAIDIIPVWHDCLVLGADEYDRKYGTTAQLSALDTGLVEGPTTINGAPTSQTEFVITDGATQDDAYNNHPICFIGGTEKSCAQISDYTGSSKTVFLDAAPAFTIANTDIVRIYQPGLLFSIDAIETDTALILVDTGTTLDGKLDTIDSNVDLVLADTGTDGVLLAADSITASVIALDAIGASEIAGSAIGVSELANNAIDSTVIAAAAIGASEVATDAIDANALANDAVVEIWANFYTVTSTADSGSTTSFVDATLTEADTNYWAKNVAVIFTSGTIAGQVFCVSGFVPGSDTVNFTPPATQAVSTNTYAFMPAPACDPFR